MVLVLIIAPALIALAAAVGAIVLYGHVDQARTAIGKAIIWAGVVLLSVIAFGIGGCYAMMFIA